MEYVMKAFQQRKFHAQKLSGFTGEFYQTVKEEILSILDNLFRKIKQESYFPIQYMRTDLS